jgi:hypothetical protein
MSRIARGGAVGHDEAGGRRRMGVGLRAVCPLGSGVRVGLRRRDEAVGVDGSGGIWCHCSAVNTEHRSRPWVRLRELRLIRPNLFLIA